MLGYDGCEVRHLFHHDQESKNKLLKINGWKKVSVWQPYTALHHPSVSPFPNIHLGFFPQACQINSQLGCGADSVDNDGSAKLPTPSFYRLSSWKCINNMCHFSCHCTPIKGYYIMITFLILCWSTFFWSMCKYWCNVYWTFLSLTSLAMSVGLECTSQLSLASLHILMTLSRFTTNRDEQIPEKQKNPHY